MSKFPNVADLIPHQAPMIFIDKLIDVAENSVHCQLVVSEKNPFFEEQTKTVGAWIGIEYMAQTIAAWSGYQHYLKGEISPIGFLLGSRRYDTEMAYFNLGDVVDIYAEKLMENESMSVFSCSIKCAGKVLASAQLNVFVPSQDQLKQIKRESE